MKTHPEVPATQVETNDHVSWTILQTVIVCLDIEVQESLMVDTSLLHPFNHGLGAEIRQQRVVELNVT